MPVFKFSTTTIALFAFTTLLLILTQAPLITAQEQPIWVYSDWDADCKQTQCGYGLLDRDSWCVIWSTGVEVDESQCKSFYGPPIEVMECVFSQPDAAIACGGQYGTKGYECKYNDAFDHQKIEDQYMKCQCKPNWTGDYCQIPPPPGPTPDPDPKPQPDKKGFSFAKVLLWLLVAIAIIAVILGVIFLVLKLKQRGGRVEKNESISVGPIHNEAYHNMDNGQEDTIYA